ncbi:Cytochrome c oxidase assembly protein COX19 [Trichuris trichiura]|uniref:Cytochrome c oxidase assembly protein COX19 n=1 Tax=Trichuris trichiura TaxID=36087 RepID=A0A077ZET7_TRITR|nr:Cytochrome c oxidase assembly protein COX19 [Trichuris trichiura]
MSYTYRQSAIEREPPLKGSFPLDHDGVCKLQMLDYMLCLQSNGLSSSPCHNLAKEYLKCRMENNLMLEEDMDKLGFKEKSKNQLNEKSP